MKTGIHIDYKQLRAINPEAARKAVLEYLKTNGGNIADCARVFSINRPVIYDIINKEKQGDLTDRSRRPYYCPNQTTPAIEEVVIRLKNKTRLGPKRLSRYLKKYEGIIVAAGTIRHIVRRNKNKLSYPIKGRKQRKEKREFIDWYSAKPFEIVQVDVKFIRDHKALTKKQIIHLDNCNIPNYQWGGRLMLIPDSSSSPTQEKNPGLMGCVSIYG